MEVEFAWGVHDRGNYEFLSRDREPETDALRTVLDACDGCSIPVTFDVVGHLLEESCSGSHPSPHADDWFEADPGTDVDTHPQFYAPDLVSLITDRKVDHEVATHTYSHALLDEVSRETIDWEFERVMDRHAESGLASPTSLVPPRHRDAPLGLLADHGINAVRVPYPDYRRPDTSGKIESLYWLVTRTHPIGGLSVEDGVVLTSGTHHPSLSTPLLPVGQRPVNPLLRVLLPTRIRQRVHYRYLRSALDRAIERDAHLHLWTHLYEIANPTQLRPVVSFLEYLSERAASNDAWMRTMDELRECVPA